MKKINLKETHIRSSGEAMTDLKLLIFWPHDGYALGRSLAKTPASAFDEQDARLLMGKIIAKQASEIALLIYGLVTLDQSVYLQQCGLDNIGAVSRNTTSGPDSIQSPVQAPMWITAHYVSPNRGVHEIRSLRLNLNDVSRVPSATTVVRYTVPNSHMLQYFSLDPLHLGPVSGMKLIKLGTTILGTQELQTYLQERENLYRPTLLQRKFFNLTLLDPAKGQTLRHARRVSSASGEGMSLSLAIQHINQMQLYLQSLTTQSSKTSVRRRMFPVYLNNSARGLVFALEQTLIATKTCLNFSMEARQHASGFRGNRMSLTALSASACQLDVRISQLLIVPRLASRLRQNRQGQHWQTKDIAAPYIGLWNAIWLIANDIILGHVVSLVLLQHRQELSRLFRLSFEFFYLHAVLWLLTWLGNWPAGLKLNTELSLFFGDAYTSLTHCWNDHFLTCILPRMENLVVLCALAGRFFGVTMVLCLFRDVLAICTLHVTAFYSLSLQMMHFFVYVLSALFDLFRGKKRNVLRGGRLDNASYELDQLLLGTTLFTLVAFLFPTIYVYYLAFALVRLTVVGFEVAIIETCLGLLNHLPLFALMLRLKDPHRLPVGVVFDEIPSDEDNTCQFSMRSSSMSWSDIFEGYAEHVNGLTALPSMFLRCILGQALRR